MVGGDAGYEITERDRDAGRGHGGLDEEEREEGGAGGGGIPGNGGFGYEEDLLGAGGQEAELDGHGGDDNDIGGGGKLWLAVGGADKRARARVWLHRPLAVGPAPKTHRTGGRRPTRRGGQVPDNSQV